MSNIDAERDYIVYLSRNGHNDRKVLNEEAVVEQLRGFAAQHLLELKVKERQHPDGFDGEKQLFSRAMIVIGPHGGAFANMLFMQSGSYIVEFNGWMEQDFRPYFYAVSQANGLHYYYVAPSPFHYHGEGSDMTINLEHLRLVMDKVSTAMRSSG